MPETKEYIDITDLTQHKYLSYEGWERIYQDQLQKKWRQWREIALRKYGQQRHELMSYIWLFHMKYYSDETGVQIRTVMAHSYRQWKADVTGHPLGSKENTVKNREVMLPVSKTTDEPGDMTLDEYVFPRQHENGLTETLDDVIAAVNQSDHPDTQILLEMLIVMPTCETLAELADKMGMSPSRLRSLRKTCETLTISYLSSCEVS